MINLLDQLFKYNKAANLEYIHALESNANFPDRAHELMIHILNAQEIWMDRLSPIAGKKSILPWDRRNDINKIELNSILYERTEKFLKDNQVEILSRKKIHYRTTKGDSFENTVADILYHIINHATYHRGQISIYLRAKDTTPPNSDYIFYVREL